MRIFADYHELLTAFPHYRSLIAEENADENLEVFENPKKLKRRLSSASNRVSI